MGDWNVVQNYDKDTFNYQSENNPRAQIKVHQIMNDLDLVDIWRVQQSSQKRFSWRDPNKKQGRLDYFCISSDHLLWHQRLGSVIGQIIHLYV